MDQSYFDEIGGEQTLKRVHRILYDKLFSHPWLKDFFQGRPRWFQESQQTNFMMDLFGGPKKYGGRMPASAHQHLFITEEIFAIRHKLLGEALSEAAVPEHLHKRWLDYDWGMRRALIKQSPDECEGRFRTEAVIIVPKPH